MEIDKKWKNDERYANAFAPSNRRDRTCRLRLQCVTRITQCWMHSQVLLKSRVQDRDGVEEYNQKPPWVHCSCFDCRPRKFQQGTSVFLPRRSEMKTRWLSICWRTNMGTICNRKPQCEISQATKSITVWALFHLDCRVNLITACFSPQRFPVEISWKCTG